MLLSRMKKPTRYLSLFPPLGYLAAPATYPDRNYFDLDVYSDDKLFNAYLPRRIGRIVAGCVSAHGLDPNPRGARAYPALYRTNLDIDTPCPAEFSL